MGQRILQIWQMNLLKTWKRGNGGEYNCFSICACNLFTLKNEKQK
jgi:hypothetical protein